MDASSPTMTSTSRGPAAGAPDLLHRLPNEILLDVLRACRDATSLWSLARASRRLWALFGARALEALAPVLHSAAPSRVLSLMHWALQLRTGTVRPGRWWCSWDAAESTPRQWAPLDPFGPAATPAMARRLASLAHRVEVLAHACLERCARRCIATRPPEARAALAAAGRAEEGPPGRGYRVDAPCWIEEQRAVYALWRLQVFYELKAARVRGLLARLDWSDLDLDLLGGATADRFYGLYGCARGGWYGEQLATVDEFVGQLGGITSEEIKFHEERVAAASKTDASDRAVSHYLRRLRLPDCPPWMPATGWSWPDRPRSRAAAQELWGPAEGLEAGLAGWYAYWERRRMRIYLVSWTELSSYRRYGFAFWTLRRLVDWGFCEPGEITNESPSCQAWRDLLSEEERQEAFLLMLDLMAAEEAEQEAAREMIRQGWPGFRELDA